MQEKYLLALAHFLELSSMFPKPMQRKNMAIIIFQTIVKPHTFQANKSHVWLNGTGRRKDQPGDPQATTRRMG